MERTAPQLMEEEVTAPAESGRRAFSRRLEERPWVNPYIAATRQFPGFLYPFDDEAADGAALRARAADAGAVVLELGAGSGGHLIERAKRRPDALFIGVELRYKRSVRMIEKAQQCGLTNLIVARTDARIVTASLGSRSVETMYVNFPDPWEKRKRWKHRLLAPWLLDAAASLLTDGGELRVKTDHRDYFDWFREGVEPHGVFSIADATADLYASPLLEGNVSTEFEKLFCSQGLPIYYLRLVRRTAAGA